MYTIFQQDLTSGLIPTQHPCIPQHFTPTFLPIIPLHLMAILLLARHKAMPATPCACTWWRQVDKDPQVQTASSSAAFALGRLYGLPNGEGASSKMFVLQHVPRPQWQGEFSDKCDLQKSQVSTASSSATFPTGRAQVAKTCGKVLARFVSHCTIFTPLTSLLVVRTSLLTLYFAASISFLLLDGNIKTVSTENTLPKISIPFQLSIIVVSLAIWEL